MSKYEREPLTTRKDDDTAKWDLVRNALGQLRFGSIHLTVHEGRLVQIDITEKTRLPA